MTECSRVSTVSKNYAKALLDVADEFNSLDLIKTQLDDIKSVLQSSKDLQIVMENSSISSAKKIEILTSIFGNKIDEKLMNFLKFLDKKSNKKNVEVISPIELNFETKSNILFKLEHKLNCEVVPHWTVDESIIAGLAFKFDDYVIDTSVRNKIENLCKNISR